MSTDKYGTPVVLDLDASVYRLSAVKKAAYKFGDRSFVEIQTLPQSTIRVILTPKARTDDSSESLEGSYRNEVLDQELRELIQDETVGVRNLLLAQAFSATSMTEPAGDGGDCAEDPVRIRQSGHAEN